MNSTPTIEKLITKAHEFNDNSRAFGVVTYNDKLNKVLFVLGNIKKNFGAATTDMKVYASSEYKEKPDIKNVIHDDLLLMHNIDCSARFTDCGYAVIESITIDDEYKRNGIGSLLLHISEDLANLTGYNKIYAEKNAVNLKKSIRNSTPYMNYLERRLGKVGQAVADTRSNIFGISSSDRYKVVNTFLIKNNFPRSMCNFNQYQFPFKEVEPHGYLEEENMNSICISNMDALTDFVSNTPSNDSMEK